MRLPRGGGVSWGSSGEGGKRALRRDGVPSSCFGGSFDVSESRRSRRSAAHAVFSYEGVSFTYDKNNCIANCDPKPALRYTFGYYEFNVWYCCTTIGKVSGSGSNNENGKNGCAVNDGWIPNTNQPAYDNQYYLDHTEANGGSLVQGTAWLIRNHRYGGADQANCNSTATYERDELLVHSEMDDDHNQDPSDPERFRWDGDSDYFSDGCIKIGFQGMHNSPGSFYGATNSLDWYWHQRGGSDAAQIPLTVQV